MVVTDELTEKPSHLGRVRSRLNRPTVLMIFLVLASIDPGGIYAASCGGLSGEAAVSACQMELNRDPKDIDTRLALADVLLELKRNKEAVDVLSDGLMIYPGSEVLKQRLAFAKSNLGEQAWIEKQRAKRAAEEKDKIDTTTKLNMIRCSKLQGETALEACNAGLKVLPNDVTLLTGQAEALFDLNRIPGAITAYQRVLRQDPTNVDIKKKLNVAESKRQISVAKCLHLSGSTGLSACNEGLLSGAKDEATIRTRQGDLLVEMQQPEKALDAYRMAQKLDPRKTHVRESIAALSAPPKPSPTREAAREPRATQIPEPTQRDAPRPQKVATSQPEKGETVSVLQNRYSNAPIAPGVTF